MNKLIFATNNPNKLKEVQAILGDKFVLCTPADFGITEDIPEDQETIEGNASQKAQYIYQKTGANCFADDTGLEIAFLDGAPGVYSARFAGPEKDAEANMNLVLEKMKTEREHRDASFRTVISLIIDGQEHQFEGVVYGDILTEKRGIDGFGYDPIFVPDGYDCTFAEMELEQKNRISHRALAVEQLVDFLEAL